MLFSELLSLKEKIKTKHRLFYLDLENIPAKFENFLSTAFAHSTIVSDSVVQLFGICSYLVLVYYVLLYCISMCICNSFCVFMLVIQAKLSSETPVNLLQHFFEEFIANLW